MQVESTIHKKTHKQEERIYIMQQMFTILN